MAKKKQEQQEQSQDEHVMAILDKRTNKTAVVSKMNEQNGSLETVPPDKKNSSSFLKLDRTSPLELFFTNFKNQYNNPTSFSFFLVPLVLLEKTLNSALWELTNNCCLIINAWVKCLKEESPQKLFLSPRM